MTSLKPFGRRIHVRPEKAESVIKSQDASLVERATVVSIGPDVKVLKPGDRVLFTSFGVDSVDLDGERHYFLMEDDSFILATES
jgi:co-chaperonin GroES (HSP10)